MNNAIGQLTFAPDLNLVLTSVLASVISFIPRLLVAVIVFLVAKVLANYIANIVMSVLKALNFSRIIASFELGMKLSEEFETGLIRTISLIAQYIVVYIGLIVALQILGLTELAAILASLVTVLPRIISALVILIIGVVLAGFIESMVKKALITFDPATARLGWKTASYIVVSFFALMSLAELGLAATFINTLFMGLVAALSLAFGLSIGLGAKDLVHEILGNWYNRRQMVRQTKVPGKNKK